MHTPRQSSRFRDLVAESGGPGCDVLCGRRGGLLRKLCWLVVVALLVGQCAHECVMVFSEYAGFPVATSYSSEQGLAMAFPAVTVCNANPLRRSRLCAAQASLRGSKGAPEKVLERNCADNSTYDDPNGADDGLSQQLQVWMAQRNKEERSTVRRLFRLGHQLGDTVVHCRYARRNCTDTRFFSTTFDSHYGNCFCFHCGSTEKKNEEFYLYQTAASPEDGLDLVLDAQAHEYLPTSMEMGFVVMVHGHGFRPVLCNDAVFAEPGYVTYISLAMEKRTALPEPYQYPCRSRWPHPLRGFSLNNSMYTREDCLYVCQQDHTRRMCGCENRDLPTTSNRRGGKAYPICEESREQCLREVQVIMNLESIENVCRCHRSCVNLDYHREVSRTALPESFMAGSDGTKRALARIRIYFTRDTYLKVTSVPKYDGARVVSSFGGINGMYLGVSFFVLFGMFETLVRAVRLLWRRPSGTSRRRPWGHRGGRHPDEKHGVQGISLLTGVTKERTAFDNYQALPTKFRGGDFRSRIPLPRFRDGHLQQNRWENRDHVTGFLSGQREQQHHPAFMPLAVLPVLLAGTRRQYAEERGLHN
ncbi:acid-sensing ion channel 3-like [Dermacentor variabilis]|uniref:acid-sensing ion channel 3-like n=1 Tax=Dermacentor variabilis TaxID=34621 RepID=UPI003F5B6A07